MRTVYLNGEFLPLSEAKLPIMDRGTTFGDGVYEVSSVLDGRLVDNDAHLARLFRSLGEIRMGCPVAVEAIPPLQHELIRRNDLIEGVVYIQVTRGTSERDFPFPANTPPNMFMFTQVKTIIDSPLAKSGAKVISTDDLRWARRDIKSTALLAQVLAKQAAHEAGAYEALMVGPDGTVTEGSSSSAFILTGDRRIITRKADTSILPGITRKAVMALAAEQDLVVVERDYTLDEAKGAAEMFLTSASSFVMPVISLDGQTIGDGTPGPMTRRMRDLYIAFARASAS